jgi:short-subunit dehydrogenase
MGNSVVVTGATSGIGLLLAPVLARLTRRRTSR